MGSPYDFSKLYRSYSHFFEDTPDADAVTLSEEEKRKKAEEENFRNLPWYMRYDKEIKEGILGSEEHPTAAGYLVKGVKAPFEAITKGRDIATSAIAGVPTQPFRETLEGAFAPNEDFGDTGGAFPGVGESGGLPLDLEVKTPPAIKELGFKGLEAVTDPSQLAPIGALGPVGAAITAPIFGPEMISAGGEQLGLGSSEALRESDPEEANRLLAAGAFDVGMGGLAIKHPLEKAGRELSSAIPSLEKPVGEIASETLFPPPSAERGAAGDVSKLNTFEDSQFRKYGREWREQQSPEEASYHQQLLTGTTVNAPLNTLAQAISDPAISVRVDELVSEGYEVNRAIRIAKAEMSEIPEEHLTPDDVSDYMSKEAEKEILMEAEPLGLEAPIKAPPPPMQETPINVEPLKRGRSAKVKSPLEVAGIEEKPIPGETKTEKAPSEKSLLDDITDLPKTLRSGFDVSFPLRQGLFLLNRPEGFRGVGRGFKSFQESEHNAVQADLASRPNADLYEKSGLQQIKYDPKQLEQRSEEFPATAFAEKLPGLKQSGRIFIDQGNLMRANVFDALAEKWKAQNKTPENRPDLYKGAAKYLNVLTGRDTLPKRLARAGYILNKLMFSPRFVKSRLQLLNPVFYAKLPREVQLEALRDVGGTLGTLGILLGGTVAAARQAGYGDDDIDIKTDLRETGFGKLKIGPVSYDFFSSLLPLIRTASRITTGTKITPSGEYQLGGLSGRSALGIESDLPQAPFGASVGSELATFGEGKLAPVPSAVKGLATGKGFAGEEYGLPQAGRDLFVPMAATEFIQALNDYDAKTAAMTLPGLLGVGVQVDIPREKVGRSKSSSSSSSSGSWAGKKSSSSKRKRNW